jgi:hypothetical protein
MAARRQWVEELDRTGLLNLQELAWVFAAIDQGAAKYWLPTVGGASAAGVGSYSRGVGVDAASGVIGSAGAVVGVVLK